MNDKTTKKTIYDLLFTLKEPAKPKFPEDWDTSLPGLEETEDDKDAWDYDITGTTMTTDEDDEIDILFDTDEPLKGMPSAAKPDHRSSEEIWGEKIYTKPPNDTANISRFKNILWNRSPSTRISTVTVRSLLSMNSTSPRKACTELGRSTGLSRNICVSILNTYNYEK